MWLPPIEMVRPTQSHLWTFDKISPGVHVQAVRENPTSLELSCRCAESHELFCRGLERQAPRFDGGPESLRSPCCGLATQSKAKPNENQSEQLLCTIDSSGPVRLIHYVCDLRLFGNSPGQLSGDEIASRQRKDAAGIRILYTLGHQRPQMMEHRDKFPSVVTNKQTNKKTKKQILQVNIKSSLTVD
ncbi:hypothetical protein PoB_003208600 [Plakobranchus ocellatus]|uniref:Uncharacterized protein n=1 Tax=Plakobranchus ocellatus TaxID=259542 RepID=A0AAV4AG19_9GAST|nr:hypothetical protein PoB_003208600 [Plakobranchus ocellatus]